ESLEAVDHQRDGTRRGRCRWQPTTNGAWPRDGESPPARAGWRANDLRVRDHSYTRNSSSILRLAISCGPSMHLAYRLSRTSTLLPARSATSVGSTPELSQVDRAECRRSYGRAASGEATTAGGSPSARASCQTR